MSEMRMTVFNVERGLCVFVRSPNGYGVLIDCGKAAKFSPAKWIVENEKNWLTCWNDHALAWMIVTHPHDDHVEDIEYLTANLEPAVLSLQRDFDWDEILNPENGEKPSENTQAYYDWQQRYNLQLPLPDLGMEMNKFCLTPQQSQAIDPDMQHLLNNASYVTILTYKNRRIVISGDNETKGWEKLLENMEFCKAIKGTDFFVTPHHGHESGFCASLYETMGKPLLNITSERGGDESVCAFYRDASCARGMSFDGVIRRHLTTRQGRSITVTIPESGESRVRYSALPENLS